MASMIDGESYLGKVMVRPLSSTDKITMYLWPMRCLKSKMGGPTFGIDVNGEEIIRYDPHGPRGHWHLGGYDKLGAGGSHVEFPEGLADINGQVSWALAQIRDEGRKLLTDSGHPQAAAALDDELVKTATAEALTHLEQEGDWHSRAVAQGLVAAD